MATIKSQMTLNDGMSGVLAKIVKGLNTTLQSFEAVQAASGQAMDTSLIQAAQVELAQANAEIKAMEDNYKRAAREEEKLNQGLRDGASAADGMLGKITAMVGAYAGISKIKGFVTDSLEAADVQIGAQVQLKTVMSNTGALGYYDQVLDKAADIQSRGMYGDEAMIAGAGELATYFSDGEALLRMMDTLTNYAAGMSGGGALDTTAMVEYATGIGKIMTGSYDAMSKKGFEFTEVQKAIIEGTTTQSQIVQELGADYVGLSQEMQAAAVIGSVVDEGWAGLYKTMSKTPKGQIISFNNALGDIRETVGTGIYPAVLKFMNVFRQNLPQIKSLALGFAGTLSLVLDLLTWIASGAIEVGTAIMDNWSWLGPVVMVVVGALLTYRGAMFLVNLAEGIHNGLLTLSEVLFGKKTAAMAADTIATQGATTAQWGLNAAMDANPVGFVVILIYALVAAIYAGVAAINHFAGTSLSATGLIAGYFAVLGAHIINDFIVPSWNWFASIANFFGNVFNDPVAAVKVLFYELALTVLGYVSNMAHAIEDVINKIPGVKVDITSGLDSFYAGLEQAQQAVKDESGWVEYVKKMDFIDYGDAAAAGYNFGKGLEDKVSGLFNFEPDSLDEYMKKAMEGPSLDNLPGDISNIADNTGSMANSLSVSEEELAYLRDIAERDAVNRFTTAEVKIDMTGMTNRIDSSADLDGIISQLTDGFAEALVTAAEGVHI